MSTVGRNLTSEVKGRAGVGIVMGVITAAIGVLMLIYPLFTATVTALFLGAALIVVAVLELVQAVRSHTIGRFFLRLLLGIVYGIAGVLLLANPLWGVAVLTSVLGFMLIFEAIFTAVLAFQMRPASGWGWFLFDAGVALLLGLLILAHWPQSSVWAIGTLVGVAVLIRGISRIILSFGLRRVMGKVEQFPTQRAA
ncbi:MAG TPA: HdeD family acid-resistance protein [Candidatus Angelobacter sp.]|nr:HdeD family acid-resistance protein [Candidatus Angelobacter sp.]